MKRPNFEKNFRRSRGETPCEWLIEPLRSREFFSMRRTFGCWSFYIGDKNVLLYVPANNSLDPEGILVATSQEHQPSLIADFPALAPHEILKKWLCVYADNEAYEETAQGIVRLILNGDPRVGVQGNIRSRKNSKKAK